MFPDERTSEMRGWSQKDRHMKNIVKKKIPRRLFLGVTGGLIAGIPVFGLTGFSSKSISRMDSLPEQLSDEEHRLIESSSMAKGLLDYFGNGYSCAESLWMVALNQMDQPKEFLWAASGFGGGMMHKDLCGFLTGGIMALGMSAGTLDMESKLAKEICSKNVKEYWEWWKSEAPLKCSYIRKEGTNSKVCLRLGQLAAVKCEWLMLKRQE